MFLFTLSRVENASSSIRSPNSLSFLKYLVSAPLARENSSFDLSVNSVNIVASFVSNNDNTCGVRKKPKTLLAGYYVMK